MANGNVRIVRTTRTWRNELISTGKGLGGGQVLLTEVFLKSVEPPYFVDSFIDGLFFYRIEGEKIIKLGEIKRVVECASLIKPPFCVLPYQDGIWLVKVGKGTAEKICKAEGLYILPVPAYLSSGDKVYFYC